MNAEKEGEVLKVELGMRNVETASKAHRAWRIG